MPSKNSLFLPLVSSLISLVIFLAGSISRSEISVEEAYKSIPHKRTVFDPQTSKINAIEKDILLKSFALIEKSIVCKVDLGKSFSTGDYAKASCYPQIIGEWKKLSPIEPIKTYFLLVLESIQEHEKYFKRWQKEKKTPDYQLEIQSSHGKLISAYNVLIAHYTQEPPHNKEAFFDYLCALDFI